MDYQREISYIEKQLNKARKSLEGAKKRPNVSMKEIDDLNTKILIFKNILKKLSE